jgi:hypothetical protein
MNNPKGGAANPTSFSPTVEKVKNAIFTQKMPKFFLKPEHDVHKNYLVVMLCRLNFVYGLSKMNFYYVNFTFTKKTEQERGIKLLNFVNACIGKGLYLLLTLIDSISKDKHSKHAVHIVSTKDDRIIFKNSWGDSELHELKLDGTATLDGYVYEIQRIYLMYASNTEPTCSYETPNSEDADFLAKLYCTTDILNVKRVPKELSNAPFFYRGETVQFGPRVGLFLSSDGVNALVIEEDEQTVSLGELKKADPLPGTKLQKLVDSDKTQLDDQREKMSTFVDYQKSLNKVKMLEKYVKEREQKFEETPTETNRKTLEKYNDMLADETKNCIISKEITYGHIQKELGFKIEEFDEIRERDQMAILEKKLAQSTYALSLRNA